MIHARLYPAGTCRIIDPLDLSEELKDPDQLVWADVAAPTDGDLECLQKEFSLHPLAMEDVRERHQRPKLEHYPSHAFLVAYTADGKEIDFFIGPRWMISVREDDNAEDQSFIDAAQTRFERTRPEHATVGFLLYVLLDEIVDGYFANNDEVDDRLEVLENDILGSRTWTSG